MKKWIIVLLALLCGALASQFPEFAQQYRQRLAGAVEELQRIVMQFDADAAQSGLTRDQALERYDISDDEFLSDRGDSMKDIMARYGRLDMHLAELNSAGDLSRLWVFARGHDKDLVKGTIEIYQPAIPVTAVGAAHFAGGFGAAWLFFSLLLSPFGRKGRDVRRAT